MLKVIVLTKPYNIWAIISIQTIFLPQYQFPGFGIVQYIPVIAGNSQRLTDWTLRRNGCPLICNFSNSTCRPDSGVSGVLPRCCDRFSGWSSLSKRQQVAISFANHNSEGNTTLLDVDPEASAPRLWSKVSTRLGGMLAKCPWGFNRCVDVTPPRIC